MCEVVGAKLGFESIFCMAFERGHYAGVDKDIELIGSTKDLLCSCSDRVQ